MRTSPHIFRELAFVGWTAWSRFHRELFVKQIAVIFCFLCMPVFRGGSCTHCKYEERMYKMNMPVWKWLWRSSVLIWQHRRQNVDHAGRKQSPWITVALDIGPNLAKACIAAGVAWLPLMLRSDWNDTAVIITADRRAGLGSQFVTLVPNLKWAAIKQLAARCQDGDRKRWCGVKQTVLLRLIARHVTRKISKPRL